MPATSQDSRPAARLPWLEDSARRSNNLLGDLEHVPRRVESHLRASDARGGVLEQIEVARGRQHPKLRDLRREHEVLRASAKSLARELASATTRGARDRLLRRCAFLLSSLTDHERREEELFLETVTVDVGAPD